MLLEIIASSVLLDNTIWMERVQWTFQTPWITNVSSFLSPLVSWIYEWVTEKNKSKLNKLRQQI